MPQLGELLNDESKQVLEMSKDPKNSIEDPYESYIDRLTSGEYGMEKVEAIGGLRWNSPTGSFDVEIVRNRIWLSDTFYDADRGVYYQTILEEMGYESNWTINVSTLYAPIMVMTFEVAAVILSRPILEMGEFMDTLSDYYPFHVSDDLCSLLSNELTIGSSKVFVKGDKVYSLLLPTKLFKEIGRYVKEWGSLSDDFA